MDGIREYMESVVTDSGRLVLMRERVELRSRKRGVGRVRRRRRGQILATRLE